MKPNGDFPLQDTLAAKILRDGLQRASRERGISIRQLAKRLDLKQAAVLSHMASGRMPIPVDRAPQLADLLGLDPRTFLSAVLEQRHPDVDWSLFDQPSEALGEHRQALVADLEAITGHPIAELSNEQMRVLREVAADPHPERRWLSVHELSVMEMIRKRYPALRFDGLAGEEREQLVGAMSASKHAEERGKPRTP